MGKLEIMIEEIIIFNKDGKIYLNKNYTNKKININLNELAQCKDSLVPETDYKMAIERYSGYFILFIFDKHENEFYILDIMSKFVNILEQYFGHENIEFRYDEVLTILDEIILDGKVYELNEQFVLSKTKRLYQ